VDCPPGVEAWRLGPIVGASSLRGDRHAAALRDASDGCARSGLGGSWKGVAFRRERSVVSGR